MQPHLQHIYLTKTVLPISPNPISLIILGGYRHYAPQTGSFLKQDSYSPFTIKPVFNGFNYSAGNPIMQSDPSGHWPISTWSDIKSFFQSVLTRGSARIAPEPTTEKAIVRGQNIRRARIENKYDPAAHEYLRTIKTGSPRRYRNMTTMVPTAAELKKGEIIISHRVAGTNKVHAMRFNEMTERALKKRGRCLVCGEFIEQYEHAIIIE